MGCLLSVCGIGQLACCAGSTVCGLFSCCMPGNAPKTMYSVMFFLVTLIGWIMVIPGVSGWLKTWVPFCWNMPKFSFEEIVNHGFSKGNSTTYCDDFAGYTSVYRLMFAATMFFFIFGLIMIKVTSANDKRTTLHRGMWGLKYLILGAAVVGAFFIPLSDGFSNVWKVFGLTGAFLFLLIQFMLVIIFADDLAVAFDDNIGRQALVAIPSLISALVGYILYYIYYGGSGCGVHKFAISFNMIICIGLCVTSILPAVQNKQPSSGLLQSSLVSLYICYLTWSALNSSSYTDCKPALFGKSNMSLDWQSFFSMLIAFACILYSSIRISSESQFDKITGGTTDIESGDDSNEDRSTWSYFYFIFALGTLYMMMTLTNWYNPSEPYTHFGESTSAFWIKLTSSWCCAFLYLWTLVAPIVLGEWRDFDY